ncbi:MAG: FmdB family zinc ribbon protein [Gemmatimonadota bacterium]
MPTYEYRCAKGHEFEVFQRMNEPPVEKCIHCDAVAERLLSAGSGLIFKGSGFYITDYARSDSYKKAAETEKGGSTPPAPATPASSPTPAKPADSGTSNKSSGSTGTA